MVKNRVVDFASLPARIEQVRAAPDSRRFEIDLVAIARPSAQRDCFLCGFALCDSRGLAEDAAAVCVHCSVLFVTAPDYRPALARFRQRVENANRQAQMLSAAINDRQAIDAAMLSALVVDLPLSEVEFYLGLPKQDLTSFDHGLEVARWRVAGAEFELWFQSRICTSVK
ncbi:hypothetical protein [Lysobacter capsici]|uniref:hypothetical protein n=1 Tax=Lysobacter capsici TaxID=435897 RepID=UPI001C004B97|nr:hypothetical protein [Lysobacter capsici]QWF18962.1 hypothetical protein KME82_09600 [Lysobacter capsici]